MEISTLEKLQCVIERITVAAVGTMPEAHVGSVFNLYGFWKVDPKYGQQFVFQKCEETMPATINGIKNI